VTPCSLAEAYKIYIKLHGVILQEIILFTLTALRTSNLSLHIYVNRFRLKGKLLKERDKEKKLRRIKGTEKEKRRLKKKGH
jgi:hypothetical protein